MCRIYNGGLHNNEVIKCIRTLKYAIERHQYW